MHKNNRDVGKHENWNLTTVKCFYWFYCFSK